MLLQLFRPVYFRFLLSNVNYVIIYSRVLEYRSSWRQENKTYKEIALDVYFSELSETEIKEAPSYDGVTLLANFGGMLGLMTGMSALSVLEILMWIVLSITVCFRYRVE